jgi:DNA-binding MarR family transcriptional regulator
MLPESLQFLRLIWALASGLERTSEHMAAHIGVTGRERFILRVVGLIQSVNAEQLSSMLQIERSILDVDVERLVTRGLLTRSAGDTGADSMLHLTGTGASANATWRGTVESAVSLALDGSTPFERAAFRRMLERMMPHLADPSKPAFP